MTNIEIKPENSLEIIQRAYTYLASIYSEDGRNIIKYTYRFTYKSYIRDTYLVVNDNYEPYRLRKTLSKRYQSILSGFLFINVRLRNHYFFLPEESLIIEYDNGKFKVLDFLYSDQTTDDYAKILYKLFSSLDYREFACFKHFNSFTKDDIIKRDFEAKLPDKTKNKLQNYLSSISASRCYAPQCVHRYSGIFNNWLKHFFNLNDEHLYEIGFDINLDLTHKENIYVFKVGELKFRDDIIEEVKEIDEWFYSLSDDIKTTLSALFGRSLSVGLNTIDSLTVNTYPYLTALGSTLFFLPYHTEDFDGLASLNITSQGYIDIPYDSANELKLFDDSLIEFDDKTYVLDFIPSSSDLDAGNFFHSVQEISYILIFGRKNCEKLTKNYSNYIYKESLENIQRAEKDKIPNISEDDFINKMRELYPLYKELQQAQQENIEFHYGILDECAGNKEINVI